MLGEKKNPHMQVKKKKEIMMENKKQLEFKNKHFYSTLN